MSVLHVANQRHVAWRCGRCGGEWTTVEELGGDSASGPSLAERRKTSSPRM
jgi:hypothetical protein